MVSSSHMGARCIDLFFRPVLTYYFIYFSPSPLMHLCLSDCGLQTTSHMTCVPQLTLQTVSSSRCRVEETFRLSVQAQREGSNSTLSKTTSATNHKQNQQAKSKQIEWIQDNSPKTLCCPPNRRSTKIKNKLCFKGGPLSFLEKWKLRGIQSFKCEFKGKTELNRDGLINLCENGLREATKNLKLKKKKKKSHK